MTHVHITRALALAAVVTLDSPPTYTVLLYGTAGTMSLMRAVLLRVLNGQANRAIGPQQIFIPILVRFN